jgi:type IV pilus assembly protein PilM
MTGTNQKTVRPRLACEITSNRVIAARASDKLPRVELYTSRQLPPGAVVPGLASPNVVDPAALRTAIAGALQAVGGGSKDVIVVIPDTAIRTLLLDFDSLPAKPQEIEPVIRFRMKKSLPFDVDDAALSYEVIRGNGNVSVVAAVSPRSVIQEYEAAFRDEGYIPGVVLSSSVAALGIVDGSRPTLMLKVDASTITITAAADHQLKLIRTLDNPQGANVSASELAEGVLPSIMFFEDTFNARIEQIYVGGVAQLAEIGPLLHEHTGAQVQELAPSLTSEQNLSGEVIPPAMMSGLVGALLG